MTEGTKKQVNSWFLSHGFSHDKSYTGAFIDDSGRRYRVRSEEWIYGESDFPLGAIVVDVSDLDFDRWANSCERILLWKDFTEEYK